MKSRIQIFLLLGLLGSFIYSCGGGDVSAPKGNGGGGGTVNKSPFQGFFDKKQNGQTRKVRNDVTGDLKGMVQFIQSHTHNPSGNEAKHLSKSVTKRTALVLFTPDTSLSVSKITLSIKVDGRTKEIDMRKPKDIFKADRPSDANGPKVRYSKRAWSAVIPWNWFKPGLSLTFKGDMDLQGKLASDAIDWAAPGEQVINQIRLGMLTDPPRSIKHAMYLQPATYGADYFQTYPAAHQIVAKYKELRLDTVMVASGKIYTQASDDEGGVYSGDMRESTSKETFGVGINLANWGITSSDMNSERQPQLTATDVILYSQGKYSNGVQVHGLSGGDGMANLLSSKGNEFSHELGHHYGLGHYPGQNGSIDYTYHNLNSGWGYIAYKKRMRANFNWMTEDLKEDKPNYRGKYQYLRGAMSGGIGGKSSALSDFTYYTSYEAQTKIQPWLNRPRFDADSPTGYSKWNASTQQMESFQPKVPTNSKHVWYNSSDGNYRKPKHIGVEVITILGGYDPAQGKGIIYPPAHSNWGNVFKLPAPGNDSSTQHCWLRVDYADGSSKKIVLAPKRMDGHANALHVQLAFDNHPTKVRLYLQQPGKDKQLLSAKEIPDMESMSPAVKIGEEDGYDALK